jgi:hypothetical protein
MWHALGLFIFMPILMKTLRRCSYNHGFWAKRVLWWPLGSLGVGAIIHMSGLLFIVDLLDLLLLYTKSQADLLVTVNLVLVNGINQVISSTKLKAKAMHIISSFVEPKGLDHGHEELSTT